MTETEARVMECATDLAALVAHLMTPNEWGDNEWAIEPFDVYSGLRALLLTESPTLDDLWLVLFGVLFDEQYDNDPKARRIARRVSQRPTAVVNAAFHELKDALRLLREKHQLKAVRDGQQAISVNEGEPSGSTSICSEARTSRA